MNVKLFNNVKYVDIRDFYIDQDGNTCHGNKGISLTIADWEILKENIDHIDYAIKNLVD